MNADTQVAPAPASKGLKLNWGFTFLVGLGFFGIEVLWRVYNNFVPLYLQSGSAAFDATQDAPILGFGLSTFASGLIMGLDNLAALFLLPIIGALSDRTYTRIGRRMPFISLRRCFVSRRRALDAGVGLVLRRSLGLSAAFRTRATRRFMASCRFRAWVRNRRASIINRPPWVIRLPAMRMRRFRTSSGREGESAT